MSYSRLVEQAMKMHGLHKKAFVPLTDQAQQAAMAPADPAMAQGGAPMPPPQGAPMGPAMMQGGAPMPPQGGQMPPPPPVTGDPNIDMMIADFLSQQGFQTDGQIWYDPNGQPVDPNQLLQMLQQDPNFMAMMQQAQGGAPMPPEAGGAPMDPAMMQGGAPMPPMDPNAGMPPVDPTTGMPMDPAMMQGAPMDPSMMGGMPPVDPATGMPMDPSMAGGAPAGPDIEMVMDTLMKAMDERLAAFEKRISAVNNKQDTIKNMLDTVIDILDGGKAARKDADQIADDTDREVQEMMAAQATPEAAPEPAAVTPEADLADADLLAALGGGNGGM